MLEYALIKIYFLLEFALAIKSKYKILYTFRAPSKEVVEHSRLFKFQTELMVVFPIKINKGGQY